MTRFHQGLSRQLSALNALQLPHESLEAVRVLQLRRLARQIETVVPGHFGHGERTAHYALLLAERLGLTKEQRLELHYAALLHDIARKEKNHADVGALKLKAMGYVAIGTMIATHMDIEVNVNAPLNENELLFLTDKLVSEDEACGFEKRFEKAFLKCEGNLEAQKNIMKRLNATKMIIKKIENLTGKVFHYG
jgi:hypothetical protein